jgi:hypothetical protein
MDDVLLVAATETTLDVDISFSPSPEQGPGA